MSRLHRTVESCVWLVRLSTSVLVTRWRCEMYRSLLKHHADMHWASSQAHGGDWPCLGSTKQDWKNVYIQEVYIYVSNQMLERQVLFRRAWKQSLVIAIRRLTSCSLLPSLDICTPRYVKWSKTTITGDNEREWKWQPEIERLEYSNSKNNWNSLLVTRVLTAALIIIHHDLTIFFDYGLLRRQPPPPRPLRILGQCKRVVGGHVTTSVRSEESM